MGSFNKGDEISAVCSKDEEGEDCAEFKVTGKFEVKEVEPQDPAPVIPEFDDPPIQQEEE
jgi:hypothetical protein